MERQLVAWEWLERPGLDVAVLARGADGTRDVEGRVITSWDSGLMDLRYALRCDDNWSVQTAELRVELNGAIRQRSMQRRAEGWWIDEQHRPDLAAAHDIDIMGTPLTNALPIQREAWEPGASRDFVMAYVRLPDLEVLPARQRYTFAAKAAAGRVAERRLPDCSSVPATARQFRYQSLDSGFTAELEVDEQGLVLRYPPYWRRLGHAA
jgi:uncharacterized protein